MKDEIPKGIPHDAIVQDMLNDALGLGVLEGLLQDSTVTEIMVNSREEIYVERGGKIYRTKKRFLSDTQVRHVIDRMVTPTGRRIDESSPIIDVRLQNGSHVNAIIPPLAIKGPCITIRKFSEKHYSVEDLIYFGTLTTGMADFFRICVETRQNIFVSGETGTGKTTLLNVLASYIPSNERIITVEEASELSLSQEHVVSLAASFPNSKDKRTMNIRDLFRNALRMRPHRIVLGECRGGEALDLLQAMNTGHSGSLTTVNANSPQDIIARLETMVMTAGIELPSKALRQQIATAVNIIIHLSNYADGTRKVTNVVKVAGMDGDTVTMQDIFTYHQEGMSKEGRVIGKYIASGFFIKFVEQLRNKGVDVPASMLENDT
jgi:pilus assembly protein CpaF